MDFNLDLPLPAGLEKTSEQCTACGTYFWTNKGVRIPCVECERVESILISSCHYYMELNRLANIMPKEISDEWQKRHDAEMERIRKIKLNVMAECEKERYKFDYIEKKALDVLERLNRKN